MGSKYIIKTRYRSLAWLIASVFVIVCGLPPVAQAAGESILLPGYIQPQNGPPGFRLVTPPPILPGWPVAGPGFILQPNPSGLKLIVDNSWPGLPGYRLVRIEFLSNTPLSEERRMRLQLKFRNFNYGRMEKTVTTEEIVIPTGQTGVKHQLVFPSEGELHLFDIRTTENGETWPDLSCQTFSGQPNTNSLAYLDLRGLESRASSIPANTFLNGMTGISATPLQLSQSMTHDYQNGMQHAYPVNYGWTGFQKFSDLPRNPLGYDCFEVLLCNTGQLETLRTDHPVQWDALRSWVATGGTLLIWPAKQRDLEATQEAQLKLDRLFPHGETESKTKPRASWQKQSISVVPEPLQNSRQNVYEPQDYAIATKQATPSPSNPRSPNNPGIDYPERAWFQGTLAVLPDEQYFDTVYSHLQNASQQPLPSTPLPRVGMPPITMFQILITLFVVLIGPLNYFYFKKTKRLNWLLLTVPAGALGITALLLAYTLAKDGIGVRTWSQSYTILDQIQKQASTRQQYCLFAGITPGDGLRFRNQVNFSDLANDSPQNYSYRYREMKNWEYSWEEPADDSSNFSEQHLRAGWLPARTLKLFETREFAQCLRELKIAVTGDTCQLENKLGVKVLRLYVIDGQRVWHTGELDADASGSANLLDDKQLANLRTTLEEELLISPEDFEGIDRIALQPRDNTIVDNLTGSRQLNRRVYIAAVERWPELQSGVANPTVESWGPHIILGVW